MVKPTQALLSLALLQTLSFNSHNSLQRPPLRYSGHITVRNANDSALIGCLDPQTFWKYPYLGIAGDWLLETYDQKPTNHVQVASTLNLDSSPKSENPAGHIVTAKNLTPAGSHAILVGNEAFQKTGTNTGSQSMVWHFNTETRSISGPFIDLFFAYNADSGIFLAYGYSVPPHICQIVIGSFCEKYAGFHVMLQPS
ncbi:hypothetical protein FA13DRAFT_1721078 [Coprinellus micaceus]|uniref:Uncharacterized protein n=1 Tax=Coprinellus micaceus TaxID=71717 RepID=A0A4Y7S554_COPMI|nr:hypothetical protein FA13DRAFT_1721078 [Coprinellus micaceus]